MACSTPTNVRETDMAVKNEASTFIETMRMTIISFANIYVSLRLFSDYTDWISVNFFSN